MSYCRFGHDSDIYLISTVVYDGPGYGIHCWCLWLAKPGENMGDHQQETHLKFSSLISRLRELETQGYRVPERVFSRLKNEQCEQHGKDRKVS